jgi:hypothetical protein
MRLFRHENRQKSEAARRLYARYEILHTAVDFLAAFAFLIGSALFFGESTQYVATWLFVIGSVFFALKPTLRLVREIRLYRMGEIETLAERDERG